MANSEPDRRCYFVPCVKGVEPALQSELAALGAHDLRPIIGGVHCTADRRTAYACNLWLRSAIRVQEQLAELDASHPDRLYQSVAALDWSRWMDVDQTLAIDGSVADSQITHSKFAALVVKDAIVDQFRERRGRRPSVDREHPHLPLKLVIKRDQGRLYRNLSGVSLHKRGWRPIQVKSPLNESVAAGLLLMTEWDRQSPLVDPMCGSGTFVIEAAQIAADMAPGAGRRFAFETWPDFEPTLWRALRMEAEARARHALAFPIEGADRHAGAVALARKAAQRAGVAELVRFTSCNAKDFAPAQPPALVVVNPPYGLRLEQGEELVAAWRELGQFLHRCRGAVAWVLSGNREVTRHLGLRSSRRLPVWNGQIECRFLRYAID